MFGSASYLSLSEPGAVLHVLKAYIQILVHTDPGTYRGIQGDLGANPGVLLGCPG